MERKILQWDRTQVAHTAQRYHAGSRMVLYNSLVSCNGQEGHSGQYMRAANNRKLLYHSNNVDSNLHLIEKNVFI